ncbi:DUF2199 domain-containing protein [Tolumonas lignilytica]|uniref:DUF2199 domain-containing protein n=1 Tax=Tolumonas lignilytica TaxID=1283284 RepID=UPI00046613FA|nr:DUF2199 domain-containing protein [Tolumonas lignilytica]
MASIFSFKCSCCQKVHEGSPSFSFNAPSSYSEQSEEIKQAGKLTTDLCYYKDSDGDHYFAKVMISIPIHGIQEPFRWGVWTSLSEKNYHHYLENVETTEPNTVYFGWFCNHLPYYKNTYALAADVYPQNNGLRPILILHEADHEFYRDFVNGITIEKAQQIAEICMHG